MNSGLLNLVNPELQEIAAQIEQMMDHFMPMTLDGLENWREVTEANCRPPLQNIGFERCHVSAGTGGADVPVYVINARPGLSRPGLLHLHGGGFFSGSARASLCEAQKTAEALGCAVVSVDYRLAPEVSYAGSVEDNYAALCWMHENARSLGVDRRRIAVAGESAGGGHAVLLCAAARDRGGPSILFQSLSYPMLDDRTGTTRTVPGHIGGIGWNTEANCFGWRCLLGREPGGDEVPHEAVPARLTELRGMPPAFIGVGGLDLFVEENLEFARRLLRAGISTELLVMPGAFHAFDTVAPDAAISRRFTAARLDALRRAFAGAEAA